MPAILFVCTANRFRSPIAAACFRKRVRGRCPGEWRVASAGTWAQPGLRAAALAVAVAEQQGLDLRNHRTQEVSEALLRQFDWVVVMELGHKEALLTEFPWLRGRIFLLSELAGEMADDVPDPEGNGDLDAYRAVGAEICRLVDKIGSRLCQEGNDY